MSNCEECKYFVERKVPLLLKHAFRCPEFIEVDAYFCCRFPKSEEIKKDWWCGEFESES